MKQEVKINLGSGLNTLDDFTKKYKISKKSTGMIKTAQVNPNQPPGATPRPAGQPQARTPLGGISSKMNGWAGGTNQTPDSEKIAMELKQLMAEFQGMQTKNPQGNTYYQQIITEIWNEAQGIGKVFQPEINKEYLKKLAIEISALEATHFKYIRNIGLNQNTEVSTILARIRETSVAAIQTINQIIGGTIPVGNK